MKSCIIFIILFLHILKANATQANVVDILLQTLENERWIENETTCLENTKALLDGVRKQTLWATWIWNSMQLPVGTFFGSKFHLGSFDQCLQVPSSFSNPDFRTQYCIADINTSAQIKYEEDITNPNSAATHQAKTEFRPSKRTDTISLGICLPATCQPLSIAKILRHIYRFSHLPLENVQVDLRDCQVSGQTLEYATVFYVFWFVILLMITACLYAYITANNYQISNSTVLKIWRCFCLSHNFESLKKPQTDCIQMMHGMRVFTSVLIVLMHYMFFVRIIIFNHAKLEMDLKSTYSSLLVHLDICVDTFFVMSGLLHIKGLLSQSSSNVLKVLIKRYFRLFFPYMFSITYFAFIMPHLGSGPIWSKFSRIHYEPCAQNWWKNLLMLGINSNSEGYCVPEAWYIHCDYQLAVLATVIFMIYKWNRKCGYITFVITYVISVLIPILLSYWNKLPGLLMYDVEEAQNLMLNKVFSKVYINSYNRGSSYLIGIAMGYIISMYKPQRYRKTITKAYSILGFIVGMFLMVSVLQIGANSFRKQYSLLTSSVFAGLDRSIWAVGICLLIAVCEYGTLPIINDLLSSRVFVPLSKLTCMTYLCHTSFIIRHVNGLRAPISYDVFDFTTAGFGYVVVSFGFSYLFWLFIEAPCSNIVNLILDKRPRYPLKNIASNEENIAKINNTYCADKTQ